MKRFSFEEEMREIWSKIYIGLHVKYPLYLSDFHEISNLSKVFRKVLKYKIVMNVRPVGTELFHADRRTDRHDETNSRFSQFYERA